MFAKTSIFRLWLRSDFRCDLSCPPSSVVGQLLVTDMGRHFANLVARIEATYDILKADIPTETIDFNHALWSFGRDITAAGVIGWHCFTGKRP